MVRDVASVVDVPIIGMGGIMNWQDAIEFIMAGATAIQVGTANFINPRVMIDIIEEWKNSVKTKYKKFQKKLEEFIQEVNMDQRVLELLKKVKHYQKDISYYHQENTATNTFNVQNF